MRRLLLLIATILVTITLLPSPTVQTQQPEKDQFPKPHNPETDEFPKPETYPQAGENCKEKRKLEPWVGTPGVGPGKSRCVLSVYNCQTDKVDVYRSGARDSGTVSLDCSDYDLAVEALARIEICCDKDSSDEKCEPPSPWFDTSSGCMESKSPQIVLSGSTATVYMCGHAIFSNAKFRDTILGDDEQYRGLLLRFLRARGLAKICCDKFKEAVRTGKPCNPRVDIDCDGKPNQSDVMSGGVYPAIDGRFTEPFADPISFPYEMTVDAIIPPEQCKGCKWEFIKGDLKCNPDRTKSHSYEATWRCPTTGKVVSVVKYSRPGVRCH